MSIRQYFPSLAAPVLGLCLLCAAYLLPGIVGHDPWKPDEAYVFGSIYHMIQTGDWIVPHVGGEPFMEKPPLFHLVAALFAWAMAPVLPMHDGARLASAFFVAIALLATGYAARLVWGAGGGRWSVLLSLASLGLLVHAHMMLPDLPLMAGMAIALAGFAMHAQRLPKAGLAVGLGVGMAFLAKGLLGPGIIGLLALALPLLFREWRDRSYGRCLGQAALAALPWLTIWPLALYLRSPELFRLWFWDNNIGRFFGFSVSYLGAENTPGFLWRTLPWFLFPGWVFAGLAVWRLRASAWRHPAVQIGGTFLAIAYLVFQVSASAREVYLLPMIVGVALVGAGAAGSVPGWLDRFLASAATAISVVAAILFWFVWGYLVAVGHAPDWLWLLRWLPADFAMPISSIEIGTAALLTAGAGIVLARTLGKRGCGLQTWTLSLTLVWGLAATLWLPWIDQARSYRAVFESLASAVPEDISCIASRGLGEGERAMLDYMANLQTWRSEVRDTAACQLLLVQSKSDIEPSDDDSWNLVWSGSRAGETRESFQLYRRDIQDFAATGRAPGS